MIKQTGTPAMSPLALSDDELTTVMQLAAAVPVEHRDAFLRSLAAALAAYPETGVGIIHREAAKLQRYFIAAPPMRSSKYR
jgi:hypothetical protein